MTNKLSVEDLTEIIESAGLELRDSYGGRGMYGRACLAAVTEDHAFQALASMVSCCDTVEQAALLLRTARADNMGTGTILYWPTVRTDTAVSA